MPAVLYHLSTSRNFLRIRILRALATAGLFGNVAKTNSSISGAEVGCQGEVGVACAMAAAAACQLFGGTPSQIEYAAEMGLEHHLGLTCDPVCGLVQVPCIERNAIAAARAFDANAYATLSDGSHMVSFDQGRGGDERNRATPFRASTAKPPKGALPNASNDKVSGAPEASFRACDDFSL